MIRKILENVSSAFFISYMTLSGFSLAYAETATTSTATVAKTPQPSFVATFMPLILIFVIFYFVLIRPQQKKLKAHQQLLSELKRGNSISTSSGVIGIIRDIDSEKGVVLLEIANDTNIVINRGHIQEVLTEKEVEFVEKFKDRIHNLKEEPKKKSEGKAKKK